MSGQAKLMTAGGGGVSLTPASSIASDVTVNVPSVNGTLVSTGSTAQVSQAMLASGVAGNGPAFSAYLSGNQNISSSTNTKIQFNTEQFDTNNCFDSTTNYRFTPTVAGYYQVNIFVAFNGTSSGTEMAAFIYKNGSAYRTFALYSSALDYTTGGSDIVYLNGSTDYLEFYGRISQTSPYIQAVYTSGGTMTTVSASFVRAA